MSEEASYKIDKSEITFIRTAVLEFVLIQTLTAVSKSMGSADDRQEFIDRLREEADAFNKSLNADGSPQSVAWENRMSQDFERIYEAAGIDWTLADIRGEEA